MRRAFLLAFAASALVACQRACASDGAPPSAGAPDAAGEIASAAQIATGKPFWVHSYPTEPLLDAKVDVGTLHSVGDDEIEVVLEWPSAPGSLMTWRGVHPEVTLPDGTTSFDRERVVCRPEGPLSYRVESRYVAPDGRELARDTFDPAAKRAEAAKWDAESKARLRGRATPYSDSSRSLACLAAASKCRGEPLSWPPPRNETPLEYSERADKMRAAYNAPFVPRCKL